MIMPLNPHKTYTSPKGRDFRVIGINKLEDTAKWIQGILKWHWAIEIEFLDNKEQLNLIYNHNNILIRKS